MDSPIRSMVVMAAAASMAGLAIGATDAPAIRVMDYDEIAGQRRRYPGGRTYKPNGKREIERRLRQLAKRPAHTETAIRKD